MKIMRCVELKGVRIYAYHGYYEIERSVGTEFDVDVTVGWQSNSRVDDDLSLTVNYEQLYRIVEQEMMVPCHLLETVAERIADHIQERYAFLEEIEVTIHKPVQLGGAVKSASVTEKRKI